MFERNGSCSSTHKSMSMLDPPALSAWYCGLAFIPNQYHVSSRALERITEGPDGHSEPVLYSWEPQGVQFIVVSWTDPVASSLCDAGDVEGDENIGDLEWSGAEEESPDQKKTREEQEAARRKRVERAMHKEETRQEQAKYWAKYHDKKKRKRAAESGDGDGAHSNLRSGSSMFSYFNTTEYNS